MSEKNGHILRSLWLNLLSLGMIILPSRLKIFLYRHIFKYQIGKNVTIGLSWIKVNQLSLGDNVIIRHFNRFKNIPEVIIGDFTIIGMGNTFTSTSEFTNPEGMSRRGNCHKLVIGSHSSITIGHYLDIQDFLSIGSFTTIAGKGSVFFTHYIDIASNTQSCKPITIGNYCMLGSGVQFVPGAAIADCSVVGMGSVVTRPHRETHVFLAGNPASIIHTLSEDALYFKRKQGWVGKFAICPYTPDKRKER